MDFKMHLEKAWTLTLKYLVPLIIMTLVMLILGFITLGILSSVLMAGYIQSILLMIRNAREPKVQDLFSHMNLFLPLLGFTVLSFIATFIGFMLFVLPGILVVLFICFACFYMLPLMTDKKMGLFDAIKESYSLSIRENLIDQIVVVILFVGITAIGGTVLIGSLFTLPLATVFMLLVYEEKVGSKPVKKPMG